MSTKMKIFNFLQQFGPTKCIYVMFLVLLLSTLMTSWSSSVTNETVYFSAFSGITAINGYFIAFGTILLILIDVLPFFYRKEVVSKEYKSVTRIFTMSIIITLVLSSIGVQTKLNWLEATSETEFGIYVSLLFALLSFSYSILLFVKPDTLHSNPQHENINEIFHVKVPNAPEAESHSVLRTLSK